VGSLSIRNFSIYLGVSFLLITTSSHEEQGKGKKSTKKGQGMDDDENGGLFGIDLGSEDESQVKDKDKLPRDFQSEEDFQRQRAEYRPKVEVGDVSEVCFGRGSSSLIKVMLIQFIALQDAQFTNTLSHEASKSNNTSCHRRTVFLQEI
jgi:hypothetical protein